MNRKLFSAFPICLMFAFFLMIPVTSAQNTVADLGIVNSRVEATPTTIISRLPMVQDDSTNSELLLLTNFGTSSATATITIYNTSGERTSTEASIQAKQVYLTSISDVSNVQGIFSITVEAPSTVNGMIITGPSDYHSISFRELWSDSLSTASRTIYLPMLAHYVWASGDIYLANFDNAAADVTITLYNLSGELEIEREVTINAHALRHVTGSELVGMGQEGIFSATITGPGTVIGVYTVTDPDNDKGFFPLR